MSEELMATDDQSHYEISLTAGQAFLAFVLLLLSLAASFAFGLMIGKGQADERLVVRKEPAVIQEGAATKRISEGRIVDLGVTADDFKAAHAVPPAKPEAVVTPAAPDAASAPPVISEVNPSSGTLVPPAAVAAPVVQSAKPATAAVQSPKPNATVAAPATAAVSFTSTTHAVPHYAQLLSTGDQKTAEALAAKVINGGFNGAYVERVAGDKGTIYRVRIRFASEAEARSAEPKLHEFSKELWITK